jgi:hypothetical protein
MLICDIFPLHYLSIWTAHYAGGPSSMFFLSIFRDRIRNSEAAMGGGAHSAPFGVAINPKRRVRAAQGRACAAKTH